MFIPDDFSIHLGLYTRLLRPGYPLPRQHRPRARRLGLSVGYTVEIDKRPVQVDYRPVQLAPSAEPREFQVRAGAAFTLPIDRRHRGKLGLWYVRQRADLVHDPADEMLRSGFLFGHQVARLSEGVRRRNFARNLERVHPPEGGIAHYFHQEAVLRATYDRDFNYYRKWRRPHIVTPKDPVERVAQLTDAYLTHNFGELLLQRDSVYAILDLDADRVVIQLSEGEERLVPHVVYQSLSWGQTADLDEIFDRLEAYQQRQMIFTYAKDGTEDQPHLTDAVPAQLDLAVSPLIEVVDVPSMVKRLWNEHSDDTESGEWQDWTEWQWFTEMVRLYFPSRMVELSQAGTFRFNKIDREALFLRNLEQAVGESTGPLNQRLTEILEAARGDPDMLLFPRGCPVGADQLLVGQHNGYVYLRETNLGLTLRLLIRPFIENRPVGDLSAEIYQRTQHLIPFIKVVLAVASVGAGAAVVGFSTVAYGFKWLVRDVVKAEVTEKTIRHLLQRFRTQILALLAHGLLAIFPDSDARTVRFARGFIRGYGYDALQTLVEKYSEIPEHGPRYYRWFKAFTRIHASIQLIEDKIEALSATIDDAKAELLAVRTVEIAAAVKTGTTLLLSNLYFLDYEKVKDAIVVLAGLSGQEPPTRSEWERFRRERMRSLLTTYAQTLRAQQVARESAEQVDESVEEVYRGIRIALTSATLVAEAAHIGAGVVEASRYTGHLAILGAFAAIGGIGALALFDIVENEAAASKAVAHFVATPYMNLDNLKPAEAELVGRFMGHLTGALAVNGALFGRGTVVRQLKQGDRVEKAAASFIRTEFGHGLLVPVLRAALAPHLALLERYVQQASGLWAKLNAEMEAILLGDQPDLAPFQTEAEKEISFGKVARLVIRLDQILTEQLAQLSSNPNLSQEIEAMAKYLESSRVPSARDLLAGRHPDEWSSEAMSFVALSHLHVALMETSRGIALINAPLDVHDPNSPSVLSLLQIIGIDIGPTDAEKVLARDLKEIFVPEHSAP